MLVHELLKLLSARPPDEEVLIALEPDGFGFLVPIGGVGAVPVLPDREAQSPRWYFSAQVLGDASAVRVTVIYPRDTSA